MVKNYVIEFIVYYYIESITIFRCIRSYFVFIPSVLVSSFMYYISKSFITLYTIVNYCNLVVFVSENMCKRNVVLILFSLALTIALFDKPVK